MGFIRKLFGYPKKIKAPAGNSQNAGPIIMAMGGAVEGKGGLLPQESQPARQSDVNTKAPKMMFEQATPSDMGSADKDRGVEQGQGVPMTQGGDSAISRGSFAAPSRPPRSTQSNTSSSCASSGTAQHTSLEAVAHNIKVEVAPPVSQPGIKAPELPGRHHAVAAAAALQNGSTPSAAHPTLPPVPNFAAPLPPAASSNVPKVLKVTPRSSTVLAKQGPPSITPRQTHGSYVPRIVAQECSSTVVCSLGELDASSPRVEEARKHAGHTKQTRMSFLPHHKGLNSDDGEDSQTCMPDYQKFEQNSPRQTHAPTPPARSSASPAPAAALAASIAPPPSFPKSLWGQRQAIPSAIPEPQALSPAVSAPVPYAPQRAGGIPDLQVEEATMFSPEATAWRGEKWEGSGPMCVMQGGTSASSDDVVSAADTDRTPSRKASSNNLLTASFPSAPVFDDIPEPAAIPIPELDGLVFDDIPEPASAAPAAYSWAPHASVPMSLAAALPQPPAAAAAQKQQQQHQPAHDEKPAAAAAPMQPKGVALCDGTVAKLNKKTKDWVDRYICLDIKGREVVGNGQESEGVDFAYILDVFESRAASGESVERLYVAGAEVKFVQGTVFTVKTTADLNKKALTHFLSTNSVEEAQSWLSAFEMVPDCNVVWEGQDGVSLKA